jgi:hypothetical protein
MIYGTVRQAVNLISFGGFRGPGGGKKGKGVGPLPVGGTSSTGKGGGGGKKGGKKGPPNYSVDVDFGVCEGPVDIPSGNKVWASAEVATFGGLPLHLYGGTNGQAADPTGDLQQGATPVNYSGTCHVVAAPMDLGPSPVIPNLSLEVSGFFAGTLGDHDANPQHVITHFLLDPQRGVGFPEQYLDNLDDFGLYCDQVGFGISVSMDAQQTGLEWIGAFIKMLNTTMVWSGSMLKFVTYGDTQVGTWMPNMEAQYILTDDDFLSDIKLEGEIGIDRADPLLVTRVNPVDASNWISMEYMDRGNNYNSTILSKFDQSSIDAYGLRTGDNMQGKQFAGSGPAGTSAQLALQRLQYIRNIPYKFKVGWKYSLLEPMDIVMLTGQYGDRYLFQQPIRILAIEEDNNGDLTIEGEQIQVGVARPA